MCLPAKQAAERGGLGPIVLVTRVTNTLTLTDVCTLRSVALEAPAYWRDPLRPAMSARQLTEFVVLDIEPLEVAGASAACACGGWVGAS